MANCICPICKKDFGLDESALTKHRIDNPDCDIISLFIDYLVEVFNSVESDSID